MANKHKTLDFISHWEMQIKNTFHRNPHTAMVKTKKMKNIKQW